MPGPRILFVKLSSLGDVVHNMAAVSDLRAHLPGAHIAWAVEEAYAPLVRLNPNVDEAIAVGLRTLRRRILSPQAWESIAASRRAIRAGAWDYVIDTQGLAKSALVARWARAPHFGLDRRSARERIAAHFYDVALAVPRDLHAVERNRRLVAGVFGYPVQGPARYGMQAPEARPAWAPPGRYVVLLHAASRKAKRWPDARWVDLGQRLRAQGYDAVVPGGTAAERAAGARIAGAIAGAIAAPAMSLVEAAALLGHASGVVGVDTGLTHLAVALGVPTVGVYCATSPRLTGLHGDEYAVNVGNAGKAPAVEAVAAAAGLAPAAQ